MGVATLAGVDRQRVGQPLPVGQVMGEAHRQFLPLRLGQRQGQGHFHPLEQPPVRALIQVGGVPIGRRVPLGPGRHVAGFGIDQLGAMDESHIIRTIEYWDIERRRWPQYEHIAVLVAEDVTSRFLNVVSLFNGFIPLVVIQLQGLEVNGAFTLAATRVVDALPLGTEEEEEEGSGTADRSYWEQKASPASLQLVNDLIGLVQEVESGFQPNYAKRYIGMVKNGIVRNFVAFVPRKQHVVMWFKLPQSEELTERFEASVFKMLTYSQNGRQYRITVDRAGLETGCEELKQFIRDAHAAASI